MKTTNQECFLADDLSGALEVGAVFHRLGRPVELSLDSSACPETQPDTILGYDLNTRALSPEEARATVFDFSERLKEQGVSPLVKKIDSTMRGWVGCELEAILDSKVTDAIALCPTNPDVGRTVENGVLLVDGVPVNQTAFCHDPGFPILQSRLDEIIRAQTKLQIEGCPLEKVRSGDDALATWIATALNKGGRILCFDALNRCDLESIVRASGSLDSSLLPCGSGAMAEAVGRVQGMTEKGNRARLTPTSAREDRGTAFLIGSAHPASLAQCEKLASERPVVFCRFDPFDQGSWAASIESARTTLRTAVIVMVGADSSNQGDRSAAAELIQGFFRQFAQAMRNNEEPFDCFITGGETARTVIDGFDGHSLEIIDELERGVGVAAIREPAPAGPDSRMRVVTKPGGFGQPNTLIHCYDYLTAKEVSDS